MLQQTLVLFVTLQDLLVPSESLEGAWWVGMDDSLCSEARHESHACTTLILERGPALAAAEKSATGLQRPA